MVGQDLSSEYVKMFGAEINKIDEHDRIYDASTSAG